MKKIRQKKVKMPKMALFCALHFSTEQNICFGHIVHREIGFRSKKSAEVMFRATIQHVTSDASNKSSSIYLKELKQKMPVNTAW